MRYNMNNEVEQIAKYRGLTPAEVAEMLGLQDVSGEWSAWNRAEQNRVLTELSKVTEAEAEKTRYRWVKGECEWEVRGDFSSKKIGDTIVVTRADGSTSLQTIERFSNTGNAIVY